SSMCSACLFSLSVYLLLSPRGMAPPFSDRSEMQEHSLRPLRLALAVAIAAGVVISSPFVGDIRTAILAAFPQQFQLIIGGAIAATVVAALILALIRIRDRRAWRFAGLAVAIGGAVLYAQFVPGRVGEAHDVLLDVVAVCCGLCFVASVDPPARFGVPLERPVVRPVAFGVSAVLLAFAAFFHAV